ncbi:MAG: MinD/ParA family protein [Anaerolineae bacterium]
MATIISVHSYRGGTGKSNTTANIATLLAAKGLRVGVVDTDINSPGIHVILGLEEDEIGKSLNQYLWGQCEIQEAAYDVTGRLGGHISGNVFLVPSSTKVAEIGRILREGYDPGMLNDGFHDLIDALNLDALLIDTHPGLNEETLLSITISDILLLILRPDQQDFQGTAVTVDVARQLDVPRMMLVLNKVPTAFDFDDVKAMVEKTYSAEVAGVLPHSDEMMMLQSAGVFAVKYPNNPVTSQYKQIVDQILE